jgi:hypothetical protein
MPSETDLRSELRSWVLARSGNAERAKHAALTDQTPLFGERWLRSIHLPDLILMIERMTGQPVDVENLAPGNFKDIETLAGRFGRFGRAVGTRRSEQGTVLDTLADVGLRWHPSGQSSLSGPLLRLAGECDRAFLTLASIWDAQEETHPATLPAADLARANYLRSFPHQATFAVHLDPAEDNLDRFVAGIRADEQQVELTRTAPVQEVLTPAACYHVYESRQGARLDSASYITTRNTCFRTEEAYVPLHRQRAFTMREIVCLGPAAQVDEFTEHALLAARALIAELDLPADWLPATDPFFRPRENPGYLMQLVTPVKREAVYLVGGTSPLAIASVNRHGDHFGEALGIEVAGEPMASGCAAFGLERWLLAITDRHGADPDRWPSPAEAAARVRRSQGRP